MKILLVEDDPLMIRMYQRKLLTDGYEVEIAVNGEEGLVHVRSFRPDVVLLDIMMPKLNGLQVLERMKADPTTAHVPVVILTNLGGSEEDIERGLELGAVAYLVKSAYRPDEVIAKVKEVLSAYMHAREIPQVTVSEGAKAVLEQTSGSNIKPPEIKPQTPEMKPPPTLEIKTPTPTPEVKPPPPTPTPTPEVKPPTPPPTPEVKPPTPPPTLEVKPPENKV